MRRLFAPVAGLFALLLAGCFDYTEEVWVHKDRSARIAWTYGFNERDLGPDQIEEFKAAFEETAADLATREGVTKAESRYALADGLHQYTVDASLSSYTHLETITGSARSAMARRGVSLDASSAYRFEELEDGKLRWTRSLAQEGAALEKASAAALELAKKRGTEPRRHMMTFRFHAPRIDSAESATTPGRTTAEWAYALDDESVPSELTADFRFSPGFPLTLLLGGAAAAAGIAGVMWLRKKWNRRWE